ncbi:uncharacterized protein LOC132062705, partial [Lycium ferocissimum]|uniref:uncharacterized protein LOC132062705 n=1 Tax=Lycium ferocissimum TaxID=112874 RepID=UPI00281645BC
KVHSVTIESLSSETKIWTASNLTVQVPHGLYASRDIKTSLAGVINGVFCWLDQRPQITVYDSVPKRLSALALPKEIGAGQHCSLGISGGQLYLALNDGTGAAITVTVWYLKSNIRRRGNAVWVRKYFANVATALLQCPEANFELASSRLIEVQNMVIHPAVPHIFYLVVSGKVFSYNLEKDSAEFVYDFGEPVWKAQHYTVFPYE